MTTSRSKLQIAWLAFVAVGVLAMATVVKVEYFDSRPAHSSARHPDDVVILVKRRPVYVTEAQS
ncbi:MAG TPA: hypothetical protein VJM13_04635, partial [Sphingopyxis sp.]|nr:hypothetical protein [Sphingopyxis sp.]